MKNIWLLCCVLAGLGGATPGEAAEPLSVTEVVLKLVNQIAFDPTLFFYEKEWDASNIRIAYTGDDYFWPVYSIAIAEGCGSAPRPPQGCGGRLTARMVSAPTTPDMYLPWQRGKRLVEALVKRDATDRAKIARLLPKLGVKWMETDFHSCPGATAILAKSASLNWVPEELSAHRKRDTFNIVAHADKVEVSFEWMVRTSTYRGYVAENSPAAWAVELAEALEPCWKPGTTTPPWYKSRVRSDRLYL